jgi:hypothetical protein
MPFSECTTKTNKKMSNRKVMKGNAFRFFGIATSRLEEDPVPLPPQKKEYTSKNSNGDILNTSLSPSIEHREMEYSNIKGNFQYSGMVVAGTNVPHTFGTLIYPNGKLSFNLFATIIQNMSLYLKRYLLRRRFCIWQKVRLW